MAGGRGTPSDTEVFRKRRAFFLLYIFHFLFWDSSLSLFFLSTVGDTGSSIAQGSGLAEDM